MTQQTARWLPAALTIVAVALAIIAAFVGSGAVGGTPVNEAAGGWLSADATPVAPAGPAFGVWSIIYAGLVAYALWQLSAAARTSDRQAALRPWAIASAVLNAAWIWVVQLGLLGVSVLVIVALLAILIRILLLMTAHGPGGHVEAVVVDGTFGLYLGWVSVATVANVSAWAAAIGAESLAAWLPVACAVLVVVAGIGMTLAVWTGGRVAPALAMSWGLAWIAVGRSEGEFESSLLVVFAAAGAGAVLLVTGVRRFVTSGPVARPPTSGRGT